MIVSFLLSLQTSNIVVIGSIQVQLSRIKILKSRVTANAKLKKPHEIWQPLQTDTRTVWDIMDIPKLDKYLIFRDTFFVWVRIDARAKGYASTLDGLEGAWNLA